MRCPLADPADRATATLEACLTDALQRALGHSAPESHPDFDGTHCVEEDCGIEIPPARLAMGKVRCVGCQGLLEKRLQMRQINVRVED